MSKRPYNFIFAAGGTGGHLYPAIAVAEELKILTPQSNILFVGTKEKIESKVIPALGYKFKTIWVSGFSRKSPLKNLLFPLKLVVSMIQAILINWKLKPQVAVGAGAYVSGPIAFSASLFGSKIVLLEQNSYPGVTNRLLQNRADSIHISFEDSRKYFKKSNKIKLTGNPVRSTLQLCEKSDALKTLKLNPSKKVLLVLGGSLGAGSLNNAISNHFQELLEHNIQILWQTGELYFDMYKHLQNNDLNIFPFITNMSAAYSASDLVIARAGATTIAEVALLGLPVIFVPSTNVAANHQYKNAKSIADGNGGILIENSALEKNLCKVVIDTIENQELLSNLRSNIKKFSKPNAAKDVALDILNLAEENKSLNE